MLLFYKDSWLRIFLLIFFLLIRYSNKFPNNSITKVAIVNCSFVIETLKKFNSCKRTFKQYWIYFKTIDMIKKSWKADDTWDDYIIQSTMMLLRQLWQRIISEYNWQQIIAVKDWITDYKKF